MGLDLASRDQCLCNRCLYRSDDLHNGHSLQIQLRQSALRPPLLFDLHGDRLHGLGDFLHGRDAVPIQLRSLLLRLHLLQPRRGLRHLHLRNRTKIDPFFAQYAPAVIKKFFLVFISCLVCYLLSFFPDVPLPRGSNPSGPPGCCSSPWLSTTSAPFSRPADL